MADDENRPEPVPAPEPETIAAGDGVMIDKATGKLRRALPGETPDATAAAALAPDDAYATHVAVNGGLIVVKAG